MIDLSGMRDVVVNPESRRAVVGGGASLAELDAATQAHGLAVTGGVVSHTGVAGLTLGGGMGWLTRKLGLSIDNLEAVEVVLADGRCVRVCADSHPDLYWALRGRMKSCSQYSMAEEPPWRKQRVGFVSST